MPIDSPPVWALCCVLPLEERKGLHNMTFKVGETVVYPHHGAALIEAIEEPGKTCDGENKPVIPIEIAPPGTGGENRGRHA